MKDTTIKVVGFMMGLVEGTTTFVRSFSGLFITKMPIILFWTAVARLTLSNDSVNVLLENPQPIIILALKLDIFISFMLSLPPAFRRFSSERYSFNSLPD